jgi:hypothetical protein
MEWRTFWTDKDGNEQYYIAFNSDWAIDKQRELKRQGIESVIYKYDYKGNRLEEIKDYSNANFMLSLIIVGLGVMALIIDLSLFLGYMAIIGVILFISWMFGIIKQSH